MQLKRIVCFALVCLLIMPFNASALGTAAKAAILINGDTGEVIYEHNADEMLPMASTTKIMTALLLCENGDFEREITVTAEMLKVEGSSMGLLAGDKVTLHDLLYGLMLASGNDAANVIAFVLGGTVNGFVQKMNERARALGLTNTHFETPSGLDGEEHYTTARDLAALTRFALANEDFAAAVSTKSATLNYGNPPYRRTLTNHNKLLGNFDGIVGVKTGFTKKSGRCLVSAAKRDGKFVIAVTLNDPDDWQDHKNMLEYGLSVIKIHEIAPPDFKYLVDVIGGEQTSLEITVEPINVSFLNDENFSCTVNLPQFVYAPIEKGEIIGTAVYKKGETVITSKNLCSAEDIELSPHKTNVKDKILENIVYIFMNLWEK